MGWFLRAFPRRNVIAIAAGVLLAAALFAAFDVWLGNVINRQAQEEVDTSAKRAISLAETRVNDVIGMLDGLAAQGVNSCQPEHIAAMRRAAFATTPVKEIEIIGFDGQVLCSQLGVPLGVRKLSGAEQLAGADGYFIDIVRLDDGRHMVRLRRKAGAGPAEIAALVPTILFLPQVATQGGPFHGYARIVTRAGTTIGEVGHLPKADLAGLFTANATLLSRPAASAPPEARLFALIPRRKLIRVKVRSRDGRIKGQTEVMTCFD
jgi:hypothetical protein